MHKKTFRIISILLSLILLISMTSCSFTQGLKNTFSHIFPVKGIEEDTSLGYQEVVPELFSFSPYYVPSYDEVSFSFLENEGEQELYRRLFENVYFIYPEVASGISTQRVNYYKTKQIVLEGYVLSEAQIRTVIKALSDDYPQIFWLSQTFGYKTEEDRNYTAVQLYSSMSYKEINKNLSLLVEKANEFFKAVPEGLSSYQIEKHVHDFIIDNCEYDTKVAENEDYSALNSNAFNICGVLVENKAVCEGYSRTFQFLIKNLGIKCVNIIGKSNGENHMWNAVTLGDDWYYVDVTWDGTAKERYSRYDYFNIDEKILKEDHEIAKLFSQMTDEEINGTEDTIANTMNIFVPTCDQTAYNYYVRTLAHLIDYDGEAVITAMFESAKNKSEFYQMYIDPQFLDYSEAVQRLFNEDDPLLKVFVDKVNSLLPDYQIDTAEIKYIKNEKLSILTLIFSFI